MDKKKMEKRLEKIIKGDVTEIILAKIEIGENAFNGKVSGDLELNNKLEKIFGERYVELRDNFIKEVKAPMDNFSEGFRKLMDEAGFGMAGGDNPVELIMNMLNQMAEHINGLNKED